MKKLIKPLLLTVAFASTISLNKMSVLADEVSSFYDQIEYVDYDHHRFFWSNQIDLLNTKIPGSESETYHPSSRQWTGLSYLCKTNQGRLFISYMTGGFLEPDKLNYGVIQYSDDDGLTWSDDFLILEPTDSEKNMYAPILYYEENKLYIYYGGYVCYVKNPDCENPSANFEFSKSSFTSGMSMAHQPTKLENGLKIATTETSSSGATAIRVMASRNCITWEEIAIFESSSPSIKRWTEGQICKLSDGRLMVLARLDGGSGVERSYSSDNGFTWTTPETNLASPLVGPKSKLSIITLKSGALLLTNNDSTSAREKMTCWLSYDDGKTWPYKLVLDDRNQYPTTYWGVSYPDAIEDEDGNIFITWDQRTPLVEINLAKIKEADIKAGKIVSEGSFLFKNVTRNSNYYDIVAVNEEYNQYVQVEVGTKKSDILENLPTTFTITDEKNENYVVNGTWETDDYNGNKEGSYSFYFVIKNKDEYLIDSFNKLRVYVKVENQTKQKGCKGSASSIFPLFFLFPLFIKNRKRNKLES